jgi:hypothetical protein
LWDISSVRETSGKEWVFIEIASSPIFLAEKLIQLERAIRYLPIIDSEFHPAALVVSMNGQEEQARKAMDFIHIS